ncbi:MAG: response regulator [Chroococcidiopsidaceae cyanobacterium CP_BM_RX_35]|nr:response regulator [Chroococcidiopsidaceae cyanobacterium CP_BM_RX_35]
MPICGTFNKLRPLSLLTHLSSCYDTAHLQISSRSVSWSIYLKQGKITYASHSAEPFDRLDRHLRRFGHQIPALAGETRAQLRLMFETNPEQSISNPEYQALCWLVNQKYLDYAQVTALIEELVKEVVESFLLIEEGNYQFGTKQNTLPELCRLEVQPILEHCQKQLLSWQALGPQIWSPYQRPYFLNKTGNQQQAVLAKWQKSGSMLKGFSFYHLAVLLNQDTLQLAQSIHPLVVDGAVLLHDPHPPFEQLPKTFEQFSISTRPAEKTFSKTQDAQLEEPISNPKTPEISNSLDKKKYIIVCVDNSLAALREVKSFLTQASFSIFLIDNPSEALMQIVALNPDLILLGIEMPEINGYELCRLVRNHPLFKAKPVILMTKNAWIIGRVKAKLVGASGYLKKPFSQAELLKTVFKYLV